MDHSMPTDIGYLLNRVTRNVRLRLSDALAANGLRPQQGAVLLAIAHSPGLRLTPSAIAEAIDSDPASTSGLLDRMHRAGWLQSEPNPADGRSRYVVLTKKARDILPDVIATAETVSANTTRNLTESERDTLAGLLVRIARDTSSEAIGDEGTR